MTELAESNERSSPYRELISRSTWRRWTATSACSRLPIAMAPLALVLVGHSQTGSFATGAVMASAYTLTEAILAPASGRQLGHIELTRGLGLSLAAAAAALMGLGLGAALGLPAVPLVALSALAGAMPSGVQGGLRAMLESLTPEPLRQVAFALDATLLEIEYLAGPALVGLASLTGAPIVTTFVMAAATLGAMLMVTTLPPHPPHPPKTKHAGSPWRISAAIPSYATSLLLGYGEGTVTLTLAPLLAHIGASTADAGFLLAGLSAASAVGGLAYSWLASRIPTPSQRWTDLLLATAGLLLIPFAVAPSVGVIALAIAGFGLLIAPINALRTYQLGQALPEHHHAEGFSILYGAMGVGVALSGLASAAILHVAGPHAPFAIAAIVVVTLTGLLALISTRRAER